MKIKLIDKKLKDIKSDLEIVFVINKNLKHRWIRDAKYLDDVNFKGGDEEILFLHEKKRVYVGVENLEHQNLRTASAAVIRQILKLKVKQVKIGLYFEKKSEEGMKALVEGFLLGAYSFQKYK